MNPPTPLKARPSRGPLRRIVERHVYSVRRSSGLTNQLLLECGHVIVRNGSSSTFTSTKRHCALCERGSPVTFGLYPAFKHIDLEAWKRDNLIENGKA